MMYLTIVLIIIILLLITGMLVIRKRYIYQLKVEKNKVKLYDELYQFYIKQYKFLKKELENIYEKEYMSKTYFDTINGRVPKAPMFEGKRVLVGEHIPISANNTKNVLQSLGFKVDVVPTGKDIIDVITYAPEHYDVILCNDIYPNGTGYECLKYLKSLNNFNIPIIIHSDEENKKDYFIKELGFDDYIAKPITQENIKSILINLLNSKKSSENQ